MNALAANPPWADKALRLEWDEIEAIAAAKNLPMPTPAGKRKFVELGCGHYGCVFSTEEEDIVFKLTTDSTEAEFIQLAMPLGWPSGIVEYLAIGPLTSRYKNRPMFALWRESAFEVGQLLRYSYDFSRSDRGEYIRFGRRLEQFKAHAARVRDSLKKKPSRWQEAKALTDWAWEYVGMDDAEGERQYASLNPRNFYPRIESLRGAQRVAASWRACELLAEVMEHEYLASEVGGALGFYLEKGILLADLHSGNIGQVHRADFSKPPWVITDPGHSVVVS